MGPKEVGKILGKLIEELSVTDQGLVFKISP
jgi:hypothetical protein